MRGGPPIVFFQQPDPWTVAEATGNARETTPVEGVELASTMDVYIAMGRSME